MKKSIYEQKYAMTISVGGSITITREHRSQTIPHAVLTRHGTNAITHSAALIEARIAGEYTGP